MQKKLNETSSSTSKESTKVSLNQQVASIANQLSQIKKSGLSRLSSEVAQLRQQMRASQKNEMVALTAAASALRVVKIVTTDYANFALLVSSTFQSFDRVLATECGQAYGDPEAPLMEAGDTANAVLQLRNYSKPYFAPPSLVSPSPSLLRLIEEQNGYEVTDLCNQIPLSIEAILADVSKQMDLLQAAIDRSSKRKDNGLPTSESVVVSDAKATESNPS